MAEKIIGVIGGMGPAATVELFDRIVKNTNARSDKEHVNMIIINDPQIPDRTEYILGRGESPIPRIIMNLKKLYRAGADTAVIPCMTAHSFISVLQNESPIPIINAIDIIEEYLNELNPPVERVGLLATTGTVRSKIFQENISKEIFVPEMNEQEILMNVIYGKNGIKAGNTSPEILDTINKIIESLSSKRIQAIIAGCTELSLVMNEFNISLPLVDPILLLAKHVVKLGSPLYVSL